MSRIFWHRCLGELHFPELRASLDALDAIVTHHEFRELTPHLRERIPDSLKLALDTLHDSIAYLRELIVTNAEALRKCAGAPNDKTLEDVLWARAAVEGALDEVLTDLGRAEAQLRAFQTTLDGGLAASMGRSRDSSPRPHLLDLEEALPPPLLFRLRGCRA